MKQNQPSSTHEFSGMNWALKELDALKSTMGESPSHSRNPNDDSTMKKIQWKLFGAFKFMTIIDATYILVPVDTFTNSSSNLFFLLIDTRIFIAGYLSQRLKSFKMSRYFTNSR